MHGNVRVLCALAWGLGACGDNLVGAPPPEFEPRTVGNFAPTEGYPEAPLEGYGGSKGAIVRNMRFAGYLSPGPSAVPVHELEYRALEETDGKLSGGIAFSDIRELDGFTHMLLTVGAEWCKPCREEAEILPELYEGWAESGGFVLSVLNQDRRYNTANKANVDGWSARYKTNYALAHDPVGFVAAEFAPSTVPLNVVIDLRTMKILRVRVGEDPDTFRIFEQLLED